MHLSVMALAEYILTGLTTLCLNSSCIDSNNELRATSNKQYETLKTELRNETLIVTTLKNGPLSGYSIENGTLIGTGVAFDVLRILQSEYGFKYIIKLPDDNVFEPSQGDEGGVRNMLLNKSVDIAVAFLPKQYNSIVPYSRNLDTAQWVVLMKRPKESAKGSGLLAPFTATVWSLIIISLLTVGPILWLLVLLRAKICDGDTDITFSLPACMWFVYGALVKQGSTLNPRTDSSRILFSTWWLFIMILTAFYTANLTAFLTLSKFTLPIDEPKDINKKNYKWITNRGNGIIEQIQISKNLSNTDGPTLYQEIGLPRMQIDAEEELILKDYVGKQDYMYIREKTVLESVMYEDYKKKTKANIEENKRCTYVITTFPVCVFPRAFAYSPGFKYQDLFDRTIQHLTESGITEFKQREFLPDTTICPLNLGSKERRLRNSDLAMTYMIVGGGLITSTIIFGIELILHYFKVYHDKLKRPATINNNNIQKIMNLMYVENHHNSNIYGNGYDHSFKNNIIENKSENFVTPPPSYHTLFSKPYVAPGSKFKKKTINGRNYWVVNDKHGIISLVPQRAPSALLFQFTN